MKRYLTKEEFEKLDPELQKNYVESKGKTHKGDDYDYELNLEDDDVSGIKSALERERNENKTLKSKLSEIEAKEEQDRLDAEQRKMERQAEKGRWEDLAKSWENKFNELKTTHDKSIQDHQNFIANSLIEKTVSDLVNKISTAPALLHPHVKQRLGVEWKDGKPEIYVKDNEGKRSADTIDELSKWFVDNKEFSAIIKKDTPSGASGVTGNGVTDNKEKVQLSALSAEELAKRY